MRTVTFLGLIIIAKSIDPDRIADIAAPIVVIIIATIAIDTIDIYKRWNK